MARHPLTGLQPRLDAQLGLPEGRIGGLILRILNTANAGLNRATIDALGLQSGERVLDVGFGGGVGVRRALRTGARVTAIDPSTLAVARGRARFPVDVTVHAGDAADPGVPGGTCDAIWSVNTVYFWRDVDAALRGLRGALRPGGRLALGIETRELDRHARTRSDLPGTAEALRSRIARRGFASTATITGPRGRVVVLAERDQAVDLGSATIRQ